MASNGAKTQGQATPRARRPGKRKGPLPGTRHAGSFRKGDPRINKTGRPVKTWELKNLELMCKAHVDEAVATLVDIMTDKDAPPRERRACAAEILDRGYGKPVDRAVIASLSGTVDGQRLTNEQLAQIAAGALNGGSIEGQAQRIEKLDDSGEND